MFMDMNEKVNENVDVDLKDNVVVNTKTTTEELKELGLITASNVLHNAKEFDRKTSIAYEHFRYVTQKQFEKFNEELQKKTEGKTKEGYRTYDVLQFVSLERYPDVPPRDVLNQLRAAQDIKCFDTFEVAKIKSHVVRPDPILFGVVVGCSDRFFIAQWDKDVKIDDIIASHEG
jgi:hypothetical protein